MTEELLAPTLLELDEVDPSLSASFGEALHSDLSSPSHPADLQFVNDGTELFNYFLSDDLSDPLSGPCPSSSPTNSFGSSPCSPYSSPSFVPEVKIESAAEAPDFTAPVIAPAGEPRTIENSPKSKTDNHSGSSRKRDRTNTATATVSTSPSLKGDSPVALSRDELLKLSSKGLENYAQTLASARPLTTEEERQLKRQRRLIKNRESAQLSRLRKKVYIEELERKVNALTSENENLQKQVASIAADKNKLHQEILYLQSIIKDSPQLANAVNNGKKPLTTRQVKTAGVCLLIVLFSFGLLFNNSNQNSPFKENSVDLTSKHVYTGRGLKSVQEEAAVPVTSISQQEGRQAVNYAASEHQNVVSNHQSSKPIHLVKKETVKPTNNPSTLPVAKVDSNKKRMKIADEHQDAGASKGLVVPQRPHPALKRAELSARDNDEVSFAGADRPNTSYIYCSQAQQVTVASTSSNAPETVALLIPSNILNSTAHLDPSLLEVSCQVLNYYVWPMQNINTTAN